MREISKVHEDKIKLRQTFTSFIIFTTITNIVASTGYMIYVAICYKDQPYLYTCIILGFNIVFNTFYVEWVNEAMESYDFIAIKTMIVKIIYSGLILFLVRNQGDFLLYLYLVIESNFINNIISFVYVKNHIVSDVVKLRK